MFSISGVEYFEDDLKFLKDGTELYASKGMSITENYLKSNK